MSRELTLLIKDKGEVAYKVSIIISESITNLSSFTYENWYKSKVSLSDGIWIGNGISEQYQLKLATTTQEMRREIDDNFGYVIRKGKATLIKLLSSVASTWEDEEVG